MIPQANWTAGATNLGNGTYCTILAPRPTLTVQGPGQFGCQLFDSASYAIVLQSGVTAGTATFQAVLPDMLTWYALAAPVPLTLIYATEVDFNGVIPGLYHGLRIVITGLTGGLIQAMELVSGVRSL